VAGTGTANKGPAAGRARRASQLLGRALCGAPATLQAGAPGTAPQPAAALCGRAWPGAGASASSALRADDQRTSLAAQHRGA